ncbi:uncharacterized protein LOC136094973 [Hydra vulgaris]|uniref:uncharacterized protein LOC136094973 n=1 Tax=Hydra vulgaris TaxID=6087 RepID=UPI0032E9D317
MELLPECYYKYSEELVSIERNQTSYWEKSFQHSGLPITKTLNDSGSPKFPNIISLFKVVSSLSHGNSAPENGFSINKHIIQLHGTSLDPKTIEALRFVKHTILSFGFIIDIPITKSFIQSVKFAHSSYKADLEAKRRLKEKEEKHIKTKETEETKQHVLKNEKEAILASIQQIKNGLSVADDLVFEGNSDLKKCLLQKNSTRNELQRAQCKIETGMKRRQELADEQDVLEKRSKELSI